MNNSLYFTPLFFLAFAFVVSASPYLACQSELGTVSDVRVSNCDSSPCILPRGGQVTIEIDFTLNSDVHTALDSVFGIISGMHVPFPTTSPNACSGKGLTCPLKQGVKYTYKSVIPISAIFPKLRLIVEWSVVEGTKKLFCVKIPALLQ
ncbi:ecdysteroid-regulated 16 kDa protein [Octopus bimaculoides]|uniref:MD-2-related lipid-recognition domain-containing protein n=1 Tax=Octopus bimaculoides TaxID=37653 RepID=A0A0L8I6G4_OCTBM|nr:ecdysteroid-regulated 16 kDa protein [Octopus bimaculoides]|eukprot:XP_014790765.1 PREDICTED: ecdysteroid-regulated 16 kDa protein-like [Octopus bimaculoides]